MKLANEILDSVGDEAGDDDAELSPEWREEIERSSMTRSFEAARPT